MTILAQFRAAFDLRPVVARLPEGLTLADLAARMPGLPPDFADHGHICVAGHEVPAALWHCIRPRPQSASGCRVVVTFHYPPRGGGRGGGKKLLSIIASVALMAFTGGIATNGVKFLGIAGKTTAAYALATGVSYLGSLALSALSKPPTAQAGACLLYTSPSPRDS